MEEDRDADVYEVDLPIEALCADFTSHFWLKSEQIMMNHWIETVHYIYICCMYVCMYEVPHLPRCRS